MTIEMICLMTIEMICLMKVSFSWRWSPLRTVFNIEFFSNLEILKTKVNLNNTTCWQVNTVYWEKCAEHTWFETVDYGQEFRFLKFWWLIERFASRWRTLKKKEKLNLIKVTKKKKIWSSTDQSNEFAIQQQSTWMGRFSIGNVL